MRAVQTQNRPALHTCSKGSLQLPLQVPLSAPALPPPPDPLPHFRPTRNIGRLRIDSVNQLDEGGSGWFQVPQLTQCPVPSPGSELFQTPLAVTPIRFL